MSLLQTLALGFLILLALNCNPIKGQRKFQESFISNQEEGASQDQKHSPEPYSFSYTAQSLGGLSSHSEQGDGSGRVSGFYTILGEDGRERRVDYVADENGFRAEVKSNEIGVRAQSSADADYSQVQLPSAKQLEAAKISQEDYRYLEEQHEILRTKHSGSSVAKSANSFERQQSRPLQQQPQPQQQQQQQQQQSNNNLGRLQRNTLQVQASSEQLAESSSSGATSGQVVQQQQQQPQQQLWIQKPRKQQTSVLQSQMELQFRQQLNEQDTPRNQLLPVRAQQFAGNRELSSGLLATGNELSQFNQQQSNIINEQLEQNEQLGGQEVTAQEEPQLPVQQQQQQQQVSLVQSTTAKAPAGFVNINLSEEEITSRPEVSVQVEQQQQQPAPKSPEQLQQNIQQIISSYERPQIPQPVQEPVRIQPTTTTTTTSRPEEVVSYEQQEVKGQQQVELVQPTTARPQQQFETKFQTGIVMRQFSTAAPVQLPVEPVTTTTTTQAPRIFRTTTEQQQQVIVSTPAPTIKQQFFQQRKPIQQEVGVKTAFKGAAKTSEFVAEVQRITSTARPVVLVEQQQAVKQVQEVTEAPERPQVEYNNPTTTTTTTTGRPFVQQTWKGTKGGSARRAKQFWSNAKPSQPARQLADNFAGNQRQFASGGSVDYASAGAAFGTRNGAAKRETVSV